MNVSSCLYTVSVYIYAVNNHIILKFRISMSKSTLESGNLAEIFIEILKKSCRNLHWNLEILHNLSGNPEIWSETLKSPWNLETFPEILKSWNLSGIRKSLAKPQDFETLYGSSSVINPSGRLASFPSPLLHRSYRRLQFALFVLQATIAAVKDWEASGKSSYHRL